MKANYRPLCCVVSGVHECDTLGTPFDTGQVQGRGAQARRREVSNMSRRLFSGALAASVLLTGAAGTAHAWEIEQVGTDRGNVPLYMPSDPEDGASLPLIVSLHGYTGNGSSHENYFKLRNRVDESQFLMCVPNGLQNNSGDRYWNATDYCCDFNGTNPDDSGYLRSLIETIIADHPVDLDSIHVVGHSNGGFMSYRMACDHADLVASVASLAGATFADTSDCTPSEPVHVLQIHGTEDATIQFNGFCFPFFTCYPGALRCIEIWAEYNQCADLTSTESNLDLDRDISGAETTRTLFTSGCEERGSTELWAIEGGSHGPRFNANFPLEVVNWLLEHRRSTPEPCVGDLNGDRVVEGADLSLLLAAWGEDAASGDLDGDGIVAGGDLSILLGSWGACPEG